MSPKSTPSRFPIVSKRAARAAALAEYAAFVADLKARIATAHVTAARRVNTELVRLYWDIGRAIAEKQTRHGWGEAVVLQLARDLKAAFPGTLGFSAPNLWRMQQLYTVCTSPEFLLQAARAMPGMARSDTSVKLAQAVRELKVFDVTHPSFEKLAQLVRELITTLPWGHLVLLLGRVKDAAARLYYLRAATSLGWSRAVLLNQIKARAYERTLAKGKTHNFPATLPAAIAAQAEEALKSRYSLEFLGIHRELKERDLEVRLIEQVQRFILELGYGFCFIDRQHRLILGEKEYFVDLLFYHRFLKALVAIDLKVDGFTPEHAGKMDFYLNLLNDRERAVDDRPSIGIILCAEKHRLEVEFALKTKANPIGVAEYELRSRLPAELKGKLPTARQLTAALQLPFPST